MISSMTAFTLFHVALSVIGILAGLVLLLGFLRGMRLESWSALFLVSTVATSVTGFFFPFQRFLPSHAVAILSLVALTIVILARYALGLAGVWGRIYVVGSAIALYLNVFVLVVQLFLEVPSLKAIAPKQTEPPYVLTQLTVLMLFVVMTVVAAIRFRTEREEYAPQGAAPAP